MTGDVGRRESISVCYLFLSRGDNDLVHDTPHDNTLYQFALEFRDFF